MASFKRTKYACYYAYLSMSSVFSLPPLLFVTFHEMYNISYTLLGTLVLVNFCTQLAIDLAFTFFAKRFNVHACVTYMPLLTALGLATYALIPTFFPQYAFLGLLGGTVIFSVAAGLCEVLMSPLVASLPSDNPERDMSLLHSLYAWGVLMVVVISTAFLTLCGRENWMYLTLFWAALPVGAFALFSASPLPEMDLSHSGGGGRRSAGLFLCVGCIFLGAAAENAMTNWISSYMETALRIPKAVGDIFGLAVFALLLGLGRTLYAKYGKNILRILLIGMAGAAVCYLVAGLSPWPVVSMFACMLTGLCTSMLWPGTLILMEEKIPHVGVTAYALMAAGGDFGSSVAPQALGAVVDAVAGSEWAASMGAALSLSPEQVGMKAGMLMAALFPVVGVVLLLCMRRHFKKHT